jgi:hypothetical protein
MMGSRVRVAQAAPVLSQVLSGLRLIGSSARALPTSQRSGRCRSWGEPGIGKSTTPKAEAVRIDTAGDPNTISPVVDQRPARLWQRNRPAPKDFCNAGLSALERRPSAILSSPSIASMKPCSASKRLVNSWRRQRALLLGRRPRAERGGNQRRADRRMPARAVHTSDLRMLRDNPPKAEATGSNPVGCAIYVFEIYSNLGVSDFDCANICAWGNTRVRRWRPFS